MSWSHFQGGSNFGGCGEMLKSWKCWSLRVSTWLGAVETRRESLKAFNFVLFLFSFRVYPFIVHTGEENTELRSEMNVSQSWNFLQQQPFFASLSLCVSLFSLSHTELSVSLSVSLSLCLCFSLCLSVFVFLCFLFVFLPNIGLRHRQNNTDCSSVKAQNFSDHFSQHRGLSRLAEQHVLIGESCRWADRRRRGGGGGRPG